MESNRGYLSYSQQKLFRTSPKAYFDRYVLGKLSYSTKYQSFGKKLMEDLEFGEMKNAPRDLREAVKASNYEQEITITPPLLGKDFFGIVDAITDDNKSFYEIKTGKNPWTHLDVVKDEQMLFYAMLIYRKYYVIPKAYLVWAETEDHEGGVRFTDKVKVFPRSFTVDEIEHFYEKMIDTVKDIQNYVHSITEVSSNVDDRLLELITEKKRIDEELDLLKAEILLEMSENVDKYAESENFNITLCERANWTYSDNIKKISKSNLMNIKLAKAEEEKNGTAVKSVTNYLLIKPKK